MLVFHGTDEVSAQVMGFMKLNRYGDPSGCDFDAVEVIEKARTSFPDLRILPGDALTSSAERAAASGAPEHIVRTLQRNANEYGPARSFEIGIGSGKKIEGRARRFDVTFLFADPLTADWRGRLLAFLQGLGVGRIEESVEKVHQRA